MQSSTTVSYSDRRILGIFIIAWTILNLAQSFFTELANDEAYYWVWSRFLDWGYYEHPPLVAVMIAAGSSIIQGELGIRLLTVLSSSLCLYLIYTQLIKRDVLLYIGIVSSIFLIHMGGFLTAPDSPLFIFTTLSFILLKRYLEQEKTSLAILLMFAFAGLMYSKYHGGLLIIALLFSNPRLIKSTQFWMIGIGALALWSPHLIWMTQFGDAGLGYSLRDRFQEHLELQLIANYLVGQIGVLGPILAPLLLFTAIKYKTANKFEHFMRVLIFLIFGFFFLWSFFGRIEANWTAIAIIPIVYLAHRFISDRENLRKWTLRLSILSLLLIVLVRIEMASNVFSIDPEYDRSIEFSGWKDFAMEVDKEAGDHIVIAPNYQVASKLWFYRNDTTLNANTLKRVTQYHFWRPLYEEAQSGKVLFLNKWAYTKDGYINSPQRSIGYKWMDSYRDYHTTKLKLESEHEQTLAANSIEPLEVRVLAPIYLCPDGPSEVPHDVFLSYTTYNKLTGETVDWNKGRLFLKTDICFDKVHQIELQVPGTAGLYRTNISLNTDKVIDWYSPLDMYYEVK